MAFDGDAETRVVAQDLDGVVEDVAAARIHFGPVEVEVGGTDGGDLGALRRRRWRRRGRWSLRDRRGRRLLLRIADQVAEQGAEQRAAGRSGADAGDDVVLADG